jgi:hypothetical protein
MRMAELVSDMLWERIAPLLPADPEPSPKGGRPRVSQRQALTGIVFVLRTGIPWQALPPFGSVGGCTFKPKNASKSCVFSSLRRNTFFCKPSQSIASNCEQ